MILLQEDHRPDNSSFDSNSHPDRQCHIDIKYAKDLYKLADFSLQLISCEIGNVAKRISACIVSIICFKLSKFCSSVTGTLSIEEKMFLMLVLHFVFLTGLSAWNEPVTCVLLSRFLTIFQRLPLSACKQMCRGL